MRNVAAMPLEYSCFISYRNHEQSELAEKFIDDLASALRSELAVRIEEDLFVDRAGIPGGAFYNPVLARALCKSACMIAVYTPTYFSRKHLYCAREYYAMETLERLRLSRLKQQLSKQCGLIIPIVLRGGEYLPAAIKNKRQCYTFERFSLTSRRLSHNTTFEGQIRAIADDVHTRWRMFAHAGADLTSDCENFKLPSETKIQAWLDGMIQPMSPFPFRAS